MSFTESATEDHPLLILHESDTDSISLNLPLRETHPLPGTSTENTSHNEMTTSAPSSTCSLHRPPTDLSRHLHPWHTPSNASGEGPLGKKLTANKRNHQDDRGKNTRPKKKKRINK